MEDRICDMLKDSICDTLKDSICAAPRIVPKHTAAARRDREIFLTHGHHNWSLGKYLSASLGI